MSTKIYDGFVLTINNFEKLNEELIVFRKELVPIINEGYWNYLAIMSQVFIDDRICGKRICGTPTQITDNGEESTPFFYAEHNLRKEILEIEKTGLRNHWIDFETYLTLFPYKKKIYGIIYTEQNKIKNIWFNNKKFVKRYGYWNNTDPEDNISAKEWKEREMIWDKVLSNFNYTPSMNGFLVECTAKWYTYDIHNLDEIVKRIPKFEDRVYRIARNQLCDFFKTQTKKEASTTDFIEFWDQFKDWLNSNDGKQQLEDKKNEICKKLDVAKTITKDILINELKI